MKRFHICCLLSILFAVLLSIPFIPIGVSAQDNKNSSGQEANIEAITRMVARTLENNHYRLHPIDQKTADLMFEELFHLLDPQKIYFTQEDIRSLDHYRTSTVADLDAGKTQLAFDAYNLFLNRFGEYRKFATDAINAGLDFSVDESITQDRTKLPRAKDETELQEIWHKRVKNDVLFYRLMDRARKDSPTAKTDVAAELSEHAEPAKTPEQRVLARLKDISNDIEQKNPLDILAIYLTSLAHVYGPHSGYLSPAENENFEIDMSLSLTGIGATLTSDDGYIRVVALSPGGPALLDGKLKVNDRIIAVTQAGGTPVDVIDMPVNNAVKLIRGKENTIVTLTIIPGGKVSNPTRDITLTRRTIDLKDAAAKSEIRQMPNNTKVGIITLPSFYSAMQSDKGGRNCTDDIRELLTSLNEAKVDSIVVDLRNNGGGSFSDAASISGLFIPFGPVVQARYYNGALTMLDDNRLSIEYAGPLVVLVNKLSASASEIFAGAMQDYGRALIVGDSRTYGKGTVLHLFPFDQRLGFDSKSGSIKYETAVFFRVSGASVQQLGVTSDIVIPSVTEVLEFGELYNRHHLPWDEIQPVNFNPWSKPISSDVLTKLKSSSTERVNGSDEFKLLNTRAKEIIRHREENQLSLNENKRYAEYLAAKTTDDEISVPNANEPTSETKPQKDPVLDEALRIASELSEQTK